MSRVVLQAAVDVAKLEEGGEVEVFFPALVFLTGLLLTGVETP